jgi:hypothetical protein
MKIYKAGVAEQYFVANEKMETLFIGSEKECKEFINKK